MTIDTERLADIVDAHCVELCGEEGAHDLKWKWRGPNATVYAVGTGRSVLVPFGINPPSYMRMLTEHLLSQGLTIGRVDGEDVDTALTLPEGVEIL